MESPDQQRRLSKKAHLFPRLRGAEQLVAPVLLRHEAARAGEDAADHLVHLLNAAEDDLRIVATEMCLDLRRQ